MTPRLVSLPALHLVGLRGRFTRETASGIPALWGRFAARMGAMPRRREPGVSYGVCVATPGGDAFDYAACVEVDALAPLPDGMVALALAPAVYAVFTHEGPVGEIGATWDAIHGRWLAAAGLRPSGAPDFERYDERWDPATASGPVDVHVAVQAPRDGASRDPREPGAGRPSSG